MRRMTLYNGNLLKQCLRLCALAPSCKSVRRSGASGSPPSSSRYSLLALAAKRGSDREGSSTPTAKGGAGKGGARAVRALPVRVVCVAKSGAPALESLAADYASKIQRYCQFHEVLVKPNPKNSRNPTEQRVAEAERAVKGVTPREKLVILDERGREVSSEQLADIVASAGDEGYGALVFAIGGPFGHGPAIKERADDNIRLSKMVLNHQIARLVLLEQIYRAWTILRGEPYHH